MIGLRSLTGLTLGMLLVIPAVASALEPEFSLDLSLAAGGQVIGLTAGLDASATDVFDPGLDSTAFRVGPLQAWFDHPSEPIYARHLATDIREGVAEETWTVLVATPQSPLGNVGAGEAVTVNWVPPVQPAGTCVVLFWSIGREVVGVSQYKSPALHDAGLKNLTSALVYLFSRPIQQEGSLGAAVYLNVVTQRLAQLTMIHRIACIETVDVQFLMDSQKMPRRVTAEMYAVWAFLRPKAVPRSMERQHQFLIHLRRYKLNRIVGVSSTASLESLLSKGLRNSAVADDHSAVKKIQQTPNVIRVFVNIGV